MPDSTIIALGRFGDVVNVLPIAWKLSQSGKVRWLVSEDFQGMLDRVSYVEPHVWGGEYHLTLRQAMVHAKEQRWPNIKVAQPCENPDKRRLTDSFQKEAWRLAGHLDDFGTLPLIFDKRDRKREQRLVEEWIPKTGRKVVLVASLGHSGPFPESFKLIATIRGLDCEVVDLSIVKAHRPYDLLGLMDAADCLVTIDTMHLHLARAARCPVIALTRDGWFGSSVPPPSTVRHFRYSQVVGKLELVADVVRSVIEAVPGVVVVVSNVFGETKRHLRARAKWPKNVIAKKHWGRDATGIGDKKALPYLKDLLQAGLDSGSDCIVWTNDDVAFSKGALDTMAKHVSVFGFGCVRRDPAHVGRECFFFSASWLREHIAAMPDTILAVPKGDLVMARWLRGFHGIKTTKDNLAIDFFPVELPAGLVTHENHESGWLASTKEPAALHNEKLWNSPA